MFCFPIVYVYSEYLYASHSPLLSPLPVYPVLPRANSVSLTLCRFSLFCFLRSRSASGSSPSPPPLLSPPLPSLPLHSCSLSAAFVVSCFAVTDKHTIVNLQLRLPLSFRRARLNVRSVLFPLFFLCVLKLKQKITHSSALRVSFLLSFPFLSTPFRGRLPRCSSSVPPLFYSKCVRFEFN